LLLLTTLSAIAVLIATRVGIIEASLVSLGCVFVAVVARSQRLVVWVGGTILATLCFIVGTLDVVWYATHCPHCGLVWDEDEWRVFHIPVYLERGTDESERLTSRVATDLGCPCQHESKRRFLERYWAGVVPNRLKFRQFIFWTDDDWYGPKQSAAMQALAREHPEVAREFQERVLQQRDLKFRRDFLRKFQQEHAPDALPPPFG
jgi:hypothetical protein